jgi:hypothetical protein
MTEYKYEKRNKYTSLLLLRLLHVLYNMAGWRERAFGLMSPWLSMAVSKTLNSFKYRFQLHLLQTDMKAAV